MLNKYDNYGNLTLSAEFEIILCSWQLFTKIVKKVFWNILDSILSPTFIGQYLELDPVYLHILF